MQSVYTTLLVSLLATIIATVAGHLRRHRLLRHAPPRSRNPLMTVNNIPMMNADIVTGVSMCLLFVAFFSGWGSFASWFNTLGLFRLPTHLTMGFGTLLIAHITFNIPYVILSVGAQAAADGPQSGGRGPGPGLHLDAGLLEGHYPGDQARHRLRRADRPSP